MKSYISLSISAAIAALIFVGCKPTENNYRKAYEAAQTKREQAAAEQMRPATGLLSDDGPAMKVIDGDTIYVTRERIRLQNGDRPAGQWGVAVALFKMSTNADATANDLRAKGWGNAVSVKGPQDKHYTLVGNVETLDSAKVIVKDFQTANPQYPFIGLPGAPVVIRY